MTTTDGKTLQLASNDELLSYLGSLSNDLISNGEIDLARLVEGAARFGTGSPSEFLHEAQQALKAISAQSHSLTRTNREEIDSVIYQIDEAFRQVGGA